MIWKSSEREREKYMESHVEDLAIIAGKERKDLENDLMVFKIENNDINYESAEKIRDLYFQIPEENIAERECFIIQLGYGLKYYADEIVYIDTEKVVGINGLFLFGLCKIGFMDYAFECIKDNKEENNNFLTILLPLGSILISGVEYFSSENLGIILNKIKQIKLSRDSIYNTFLKNIKDSIIELRYKKLTQKLQGINIEINNDKKQVQKYLKNFGFEDKYNITLNNIDKFITNEEYDETVIPGGVIGIFREFFNDFYIDLANKISELNDNEEIPKLKYMDGKEEKDRKEIYNATQYIKQKFSLSDDDTNILKSYLGITNGNGAHKLVSEKKYFRLTRNIGIEICLFMLSKFEDYKNKQNNKTI